ncbi:redoxin domain-containing protein [Pollutibacter soli]|uniref:redoxin domain-containing protein n=1 Tax=Pollutibacter soli TaxID=3034157 RepID=UPI0030136650
MQLSNGELSSLKRANAWINSKPITSSDLKGKVVLIEFGTYTCINWIRTLPYIRGWYEKYRDKGLVVITVHTPEFPFEKSVDNVRKAIKDMKIDFPVAIDNQQDIWNAFNNRYWPACYLIDTKGRIRHHQFGEGGYEESEHIIQQLLVEAGATGLSNGVTVTADGCELAADWNSLKSAENYLGYERTENFTADGLKYDKPHVYGAPSILLLNHWALSGNWTVQKQSIKLNNTKGKIVYRFHARDFHLVMGPAVPGTSIRFRVLIDGKLPGTAHGIDVDEQGNGELTDQRLYQLIRQPNSVSDCQIEIEFFDNGVEAFAVTFG